MINFMMQYSTAAEQDEGDLILCIDAEHSLRHHQVTKAKCRTVSIVCSYLFYFKRGGVCIHRDTDTVKSSEASNIVVSGKGCIEGSHWPRETCFSPPASCTG